MRGFRLPPGTIVHFRSAPGVNVGACGLRQDATSERVYFSMSSAAVNCPACKLARQASLAKRRAAGRAGFQFRRGFT